MKIIKIGAIWCPGCLVMKKIWNNILKDYDLDILELDYDIDSDNVSKYNVGNILPVVIFLDNNGNELERLIGEQKESKLREIIDKYMEV
ncbi:MAG: thioredoxin family protein [Bacilli bacterium]|nr:thioredoxin family protein [Bacilli bacterium]